MKRRVPTRFEQRVYAVVRRIPKGEVRSYQWVAEQLGDPHLARAVGWALHRNPHPFSGNAVTQSPPARLSATGPGRASHPITLVPCHRVIRSDGSLGGYAEGRARKRALLRREGWRDRRQSGREVPRRPAI